MKGDDALLCLMEEMSSSQGYGKVDAAREGGVGAAGSDEGEAKATSDAPRGRVRLVPEVEGYGSSDARGNPLCPMPGQGGAIWNPYVRVAVCRGVRASSRQHTFPPTNPEVELCRRRSYEKFKKGFYCIFKTVADNALAAEVEAQKKANKTNEQNGDDCKSRITAEGRKLSNTMWNELPSHAIMERWHFAAKLEEARAVRDRCSKCGSANDRSIGGNGEFQSAREPTGSIREQLLDGLKRGVSMDPILVSPSSESGSGRGKKDRRRGIHVRNGGKKGGATDQNDNSASHLLRKEILFQWKRERRRKVGATGGASTRKAEDLDEEFRCTFASAKFLRRTQKLSREVRNLAQESHADFFTELGRRASQAALVSVQKQDRKRGKKKCKSVPKISFSDDYSSRDGEPPFSSSAIVTVAFSGLSLRLNEIHYDKLQILFDRFNTQSTSLSSHRDAFASSLFSLLARYDMLEGAGLQSSLIGNVFDVLLTNFGCSMECFASPFNCRYERYCSAFPDTDSAFGSLGSFFDFDFLGAGGGAFQANPPFVANFIDRVYERMDDLLKSSTDCIEDNPRRSSSRPPLMFIVFVPAWTETSGWSALNTSPHLTRHVLISQKADPHYYCEGTQHRRQKGRYRIASFNTSVFFLQNAEARIKWPVTDAIVEELRVAFSYNPEDDDGEIKMKKSPKEAVVAKATGSAPHRIDESCTAESTIVAEFDAPRGDSLGRKRHQEEEPSSSKIEKGKRRKKKKQKLVADSSRGDTQQLDILASLGILDGPRDGPSVKGQSRNAKGKHPAGKNKKRKGK